MAQLDFAEYKKVVERVSGISVDTSKWFPSAVSEWITYHATLLGVPDTYISYPLISAISYCAQHAIIRLEDEMHHEPVLIYGLVGGRSGTNKSAALKKVTDMVMGIENPNPGTHVFDTGTTEGLMKAMHDNSGTILSPRMSLPHSMMLLKKAAAVTWRDPDSSRFTRAQPGPASPRIMVPSIFPILDST